MAQLISSWRILGFQFRCFRRDRLCRFTEAKKEKLEVLRRERKEENENWMGNQIDGKEEKCAGNVWCVVCCVRWAATVTMQFPCVPLVSTMEEVEVNSVRSQKPPQQQKHVRYNIQFPKKINWYHDVDQNEMSRTEYAHKPSHFVTIYDDFTRYESYFPYA